MGPKKRPYSNRAPGARPSKPSSNARRKPKPLKPSKRRTAADVLRNRARRRTTKAAQVARVTESEEQPPISPTQVVRETRDGVPAIGLRRIRNRLGIASAVAYICAAALKAQTADNDLDAALLLQRCCGDVLLGQMQQINRLVGDDEDDEDEGDDEVGGTS